MVIFNKGSLIIHQNFSCHAVVVVLARWIIDSSSLCDTAHVHAHSIVGVSK